MNINAEVDGMEMILLISLAVDLVLILTGAAKRRKKEVICRFITMSVIINTIAFYISSGLSVEFGDSVFLKAVCAAAAKIFVIWMFMQKERPADIDFADGISAEGALPVYLLAVAVSFCIHSEPITGLVCEMSLLIFLLYYERSIRRKRELAAENDRISDSGRNSGGNELYLQTIEESYRKNRALMHDLNNHAIAMRALAVNEEYEELMQYIDTFAQKVKGNMFPVRSGNIVLDALLADKYHRAVRQGILVLFEKVRYSANLKNEDLCTVVGNLFDNAIEENLKCPDAGQRRISLSILAEEDVFCITVRNPLFHELKIKGGLPASEKPDAEHHGMGLRNVRKVCDKYGGTLVWDTSEEFSVTVELFF